MFQRGNAFFIVLIAVALFAALSYAVTQSGRSGGGGAEKEKDMLTASRVLQMASQYRAAATRMRVAGVKPENIHFHDPSDNLAPCTSTDGTCIFTAEGAGETWPVKPREAYDDPDAGFLGFIELGEASLSTGVPPTAMKGVGTEAPESIMAMMPIKRGVCEAINKMLGIEGIPELDNTATATLPDYIDMNVVDGSPAGCIDSSAIGGPGLTFYFAVVEN